MNEIDIQNGSLGNYLKVKRLAKNITLQEVSEVTKISLRFLEAIESDEYSTLPGEAFCRGFIKGYAKYLGLNINKVMSLYDHFRFGKTYIEYDDNGYSPIIDKTAEHQLTDGVKSLKKNKVLKKKSGTKAFYIVFALVLVVGVIVAFQFLARYIETKANQSLQDRQQSGANTLLKTVELVKPDGVPNSGTEIAPNTNNENSTEVAVTSENTENTANINILNTQVGDGTPVANTQTPTPTPEIPSSQPITTNDYSTLSVKVTKAINLKVVSDGKILKDGKFEAGTVFVWQFSDRIQLLTTTNLSGLDVVFNNIPYPAPKGATDSQKYREFIHEKD